MSSKDHHNNQPNTNQWILYILLLLLRFIGVVQRGYVHPDEFYQGGSELFFGRQQRHFDPDGIFQDENRLLHSGSNDGGGDYVVTNVPWEFEPSNAVRSIVPPMFMTLLPLRIYVSLQSLLGSSINEVDVPSMQKSWIESSALWTPAMSSLSGYEILLIPRLFMALLSVLFLDGSLWMLISNDTSVPPMEVIALASSWPCLVFGVRPFTNNLEAMVLAFLLTIAVRCVSRNAVIALSGEPVSRNVPSLLLIGATCSVGIFVRFTFSFFAFPILLIFLRQRSKGKLMCIIHDGLWMALSFLVVSCSFIWADTQYYSWQTKLPCDNPRCEETLAVNMGTFLNYIAPFNAFQYNSKSTNLAEHGLHPRITHTAVNMPMLFGPLALLWYGSVTQKLHSRVAETDARSLHTQRACHWSILSALLVLSCAPHQEPRFLLPCIVPLVYLHGRRVVSRNWFGAQQQQSTRFPSPLTVWIAFNMILYIFFGWLHQGGLLPSLLNLPREKGGVQTQQLFIYYKTYMPPTYLTRINGEEATCNVRESESADKTCSSNLQHQTSEVILDLQGSDSSVFLEVLHKWLPCQKMTESNDYLHVVSPPSVILQLNENYESSANMFWNGYEFSLSKEYHGHVSTEDWPRFDGSVQTFVGQLKLDVYTVSCLE